MHSRRRTQANIHNRENCPAEKCPAALIWITILKKKFRDKNNTSTHNDFRLRKFNLGVC